MKVEIINRTTWALETLLYTKNTRLQGAQSFDDICKWPELKKLENLDYMKDTIQSSWEFVDYTFEISGVTRAFTHQLVRTRTGCYAQESQRTIDASDHEVINTCDQDNAHIFDEAATLSMKSYSSMIDFDIPIQDARGILPTNISTSIIAKFSLRTLHDMALLRLCFRTQSEYQRVFREMVKQVVSIHPWAKPFLKVHCVWYGACAFPRYKECPVKDTFTTEVLTTSDHRKIIEDKFDECVHEAIPVAVGGKTQ